jgi:hypothetical protein
MLVLSICSWNVLFPIKAMMKKPPFFFECYKEAGNEAKKRSPDLSLHILNILNI